MKPKTNIAVITRICQTPTDCSVQLTAMRHLEQINEYMHRRMTNDCVRTQADVHDIIDELKLKEKLGNSCNDRSNERPTLKMAEI